MKRIGLLLIVFWSISYAGYGQYLPEDEDEEYPKDEKSGFDPERMYFGGGLGLQFGNLTLVDISPLTGYWITDRFTAGVGGQYMYYQIRSAGFSTEIYGARVFSRFLVTDQIFAHAEFETLNGQWHPVRDERFNIHHPLVGGGYMTRFGGSGFAAFMVLWNLNDSQYSPYANPVLRINFGFGVF